MRFGPTRSAVVRMLNVRCDIRRLLVVLGTLVAASCTWGRVESQAQDDGLGLVEVEGGGPVANTPLRGFGFIDAFSDGSHFARGQVRADLWQGLGPVAEIQAAGADESARGGLACWPTLPLPIAAGSQLTLDTDNKAQVRVAWDTQSWLLPFSAGGFLDQNFPGWIGESQVRWHAWRDARLIVEINVNDLSSDEWILGAGVQWAW